MSVYICQSIIYHLSLSLSLCLQVKYNVVQNVNPELQNLYHWLEVEFHPLKLSSRVMSSLEYIKKRDDLVEYVPALEDITIVRLVKQVSEKYLWW